VPTSSRCTRTRVLVGDDEAPIVQSGDTEGGDESGEWIVRHPGTGGRYAAKKRRLSGVRRSHQSDVGQELQGESQPAPFAGLSRRGEVGGLAGGALEARVAEAPAPSAGDDDALAVLDEVGEEGALGAFFVDFARLRLAARAFGARREIVDDRTHGNAGYRVVAVGAGALATAPVGAISGAQLRPVFLIPQGGEIPVRDDHDVAAASPVPAVRSAPGNELLPAEGDDPVTAVARDGGEDRLVDEGVP
jgi:hypothetical protein